jgi:hypothetical protein
MRKKTLISYAQGQLQFRGSPTRALVVPFLLERRMIMGIGAAIIMLSVVYGYCVAVSVAEVGARASALRAARALSADVATLESQYLAQTRGITEEYARSLGFVTPSGKTFVTRQEVVSYR